jgi:hypothetical protein
LEENESEKKKKKKEKETEEFLHNFQFSKELGPIKFVHIFFSSPNEFL